MQLDAIPVPAAVAARPRDARGFPVLAITPWRDGQPQFGFTSTERVLVCAVERRCAICGLPLRPGEAWRVVGADEAVAILDALDRGVEYANAAPTVEPPGHRACMLYSAMACPFLARPNARRGRDVTIGDLTVGRGDARGQVEGIGGAVVGFRGYELRHAAVVAFTFTGLIDCAPHGLGDDHFATLAAIVRDEEEATEAYPKWLGDDEAAAIDRARRYL